jgi:hypothetical protein
LSTSVTWLPAVWHGVVPAPPHVAATEMILLAKTVGVRAAESNVDDTRFPLEPAAAKDGAVLVAPAVNRPFAP